MEPNKPIRNKPKQPNDKQPKKKRVENYTYFCITLALVRLKK